MHFNILNISGTHPVGVPVITSNIPHPLNIALFSEMIAAPIPFYWQLVRVSLRPGGSAIRYIGSNNADSCNTCECTRTYASAENPGNATSLFQTTAAVAPPMISLRSCGKFELLAEETKYPGIRNGTVPQFFLLARLHRLPRLLYSLVFELVNSRR